MPCHYEIQITTITSDLKTKHLHNQLSTNLSQLCSNRAAINMRFVLNINITRIPSSHDNHKINILKSVTIQETKSIEMAFQNNNQFSPSRPYIATNSLLKHSANTYSFGDGPSSMITTSSSSELRV